MTRTIAVALATLALAGCGGGGGGAAGSPKTELFDENVRQRLAALRAVGAANGMRWNVFAKVGDSITASTHFLAPLGEGGYDLGDAPELRQAIDFYGATPLPDGRNSFNRSAETAIGGWTADDPLAAGGGCPGMTPLACELSVIRPGVALVMFGTNDVQRGMVDRYEASLTAILDRLEGAGVAPVLFTIPPLAVATLAADVARVNGIVARLARERRLPLVDYGAAMAALPDRGLSADGVHPSVAPGGGGDLSASGLAYGYNLRNLMTLRMLDALREVAP
ncbi:MAG: SGNH/GDSL hydrolase family protein [Nitrospinae bacterium]|nr:SGNH/GDSL hydrolase family protein [Nitrospinota bacterium]